MWKVPLWKMADVEDALRGTCQMWKVPLWKMPNVEDVLWKVAVEDGVYSNSIFEIMASLIFHPF